VGLDSEEQIPHIVASLRSNDPVEMMKLTKKLTPELEEQRRMRKACRDRFQRYTEDDILVSKAMYNGPGARMRAEESGFVLVNDFHHRNWQRLLSQWREVENNAGTLTDKQLWSVIRVIFGQWKWYGEAEELMKKDRSEAWRDMEARDRKLQTPGRRMEDWTPEVIRDDETWAVELWLSVRGEMTKYHLTVGNRATIERLHRQLNNFSKSYGVYTSLQRLNEWGRKDLSLKNIREYPRVMMYELEKKSALGAPAKWAYKGNKREIDHWFRDKAISFKKGRSVMEDRSRI
jgi:hypothetical protein